MYLCRAIRAEKTHIWTAVAIGPWSYPSSLRDRIKLVPEMNQGVVHGLLGNLDYPVEWRVQFQDQEDRSCY